MGAAMPVRTSVAGAWLFGLVACHEPRPRCSIGQGDFAATYRLVSGSGDCALLRGERLGVQAYYSPKSAADPRPDYERASIGIQPQSITDLLTASAGSAQPNADDLPYSLGAFASAQPGPDDFCVVPSLSRARLRLPAIAAQSDACDASDQPAVDLTYEWSNVRVYTTAAAYGTQLSADLRYTQDGCTAVYEVRAVSPAVSCGMMQDEGGDDANDGAGDPRGGGLDGSSLDAGPPPEANAGARADAGGVGGPDEDGGCPPPAPLAPPPPPDDSACWAADPARGRPLGSGINDEFAVHCDPDLLLCVLDREPPSLR